MHVFPLQAPTRALLVPERPQPRTQLTRETSLNKGQRSTRLRQERTGFTRASAAGWITHRTSSNWGFAIKKPNQERGDTFKKIMKAFKFICSNYPADS